MRTRKLALSIATSCLAISVFGCERRAEEVRPEPVSLSKPAPRRAGAEHGQDPRRAADAPRADAVGEAETEVEAEVEAELASGADEVASDGGDDERARARKPAKRRRTGGVSTGDREPVAGSSALRAKRLVVAREVEAREPVGVSRSFDASRVSEVAVFVELVNDAREASRIVVRFEPPAAEAFEVPLEVGAAPRWRTWATTKRPLETGTWGVRVLDEDGASIARTTFEVVE